MQKLFALIAITFLLSQAYAQSSCGPGSASCTNGIYQTCLSSGWFTNTLPNGVGCSQCNQITTLTCSSGVVALTCNKGYQLVNNVCVACSPNMAAACQSTCSSLNGLVTVGSTCLACANSTAACNSGCTGFYTVGSTCVQCPAGSTACSSATLSTSCLSGYYLGAGGQCTACPAGQLSCTVVSVASACASGFYLDKATCNACSGQISITKACYPECLLAGFYGNSTSCSQCVKSDSSSCNSACLQFGFVSASVTTTGDSPVTTNSCQACSDNALTCSVPTGKISPVTASSCKPGYYLGESDSNGYTVCTACASIGTVTLADGTTSVSQWQSFGAQTSCAPAVIAVTCSNGFYVNQISCNSCASTTNACAKPCTSTGYYTVGTTCVACGTGSSVCTNSTIATSCFSGFVLTGPNCVAISSVTLSQGNPVSKTPLDGYYIDPVTTLPTLCTTGQKTCDQPDSASINKVTAASACMTGYQLWATGKTCIKVTSGVTGITIQPLACYSGYYLAFDSNGVTCTVCDTNTGVDSCYTSSASAATGCKINYYLSSGVCTQCDTEADICVSASIGLVCKQGYYALIDYSTTCLASQFATTYGLQAGALLYSTAAAVTDLATKVSACNIAYVISDDKTTCTACTTYVASVAKCASTSAIDTCNTNYVKATVGTMTYCFLNDQMTTTNSKQTSGAFVLTSIVCKSGYFYAPSATPTCKACNLEASFPTLTTIYTVAPDASFITTIKTCTVDALGFLATYTCNVGYVPLTLTSNALVSSYKLGGCYSCAGADNTAPAVNTDPSTLYDNTKCTAPTTFTDSFVPSGTAAASTAVLTGCADGYSLVGSDTAVCVDCNTAVVNAGPTFIQTTATDLGIKTCKLLTDTTFTSFTCKDGYVIQGAFGCLSCAGALLGTNTAITGYSSCTAQATTVTGYDDATIVPATVVCASGYAKISTASILCIACNDKTVVFLKSTSDVANLFSDSITNIVSCTIDASANLLTYSCASGYIPIKQTLSVTPFTSEWLGCVSCAGTSSADPPINVDQTSTVIYTCTGTFAVTAASSAAYLTQVTPSLLSSNSGVTAITCVTGYVQKTSDKTCVACTSLTATIGQTQITSCTANAAADTLASVLSCATGFAPFQLSSGTWKGCLNCAGVTATDTSSDTAPTGVASCKAPTTATDGTVAQAGPLKITNLVCITEYYVSDFGVCTAFAGLDITSTSAQITKCQDGYYLSSTTNYCVACTAGVATCVGASDSTNKGASSCNAGYVIALGQCVTCGDFSASCNNQTSFFASSCDTGYLKQGGQCFACPLGASNCVGGANSYGLVSLTCNTGYGLLNGECSVTCGTYVDQCNSDGTIKLCVSGYYQKLTTDILCTVCTDANAICDSTGATSKCKDTFYKDSVTGLCTTCGSNVATCSSASQATTCASGFGGTTACAITCITGGLTCETGTVAKTCKDGFYKTTDATYNCRSCGRNAKTCKDQYTPTLCISGYSLSLVNTCFRCPQGAQTCSSNSVALTCASGWSLINGICQDCGDANAASCGGTYTTVCSVGYFAASGKCTACASGVEACTSLSKVTTCLSGYLKDDGSTKCTACTQTNAYTCTTAAVSKCNDGYYIGSDSNSCVQCTDANTLCTSDGKIVTVTSCLTSLEDKGYSTITDSNSVKSCQKCPTNALTCKSSDLSTLICADNYNQVGTGCVQCLIGAKTCTAAVPICQSGYVSVLNTCTACVSSTAKCATGCSAIGFNDGDDGKSCVNCDVNALTCSSAKAAQTCNSGYYVSSTTNLCVACSDGFICTDATTYTSCKTGYFADATPPTKCTLCGAAGAKTCLSATQASACQNGYYLTSAGVCSQCTGSNAATCKLAGSAVTCASKFYPNNGVCSACEGSSTCVSACLSLGYFTQSTTTTVGNQTSTTNACVACSGNALTCLSLTQATSCSKGYYLNGAAACVVCATSGASTCNLTPSLTSCSVGFSLINGACTACPAGFASCSTATNGTACKDGFQLALQWTTCTACVSPALRCTANATQACVDGFYPTATQNQDVTCTKCPGSNNMINCYNASYATSCNAGYSPVNGNCTQCPANSASCNGILILQCLPGFFITNQYLAANNTCNACGTGAQTCSSNVKAITCLPGYGLNSTGSCIKCAAGAQTCTVSGTSTTTVTCFSQLTLSAGVCSCPAGQGLNTDQSTCGACPTNCATCSTVNTCTTCNQLFTLTNGTSCQSTCTSSQYYGSASSSSSTPASNSSSSTPASNSSSSTPASNSSSSTSNSSNSSNSTTKRVLQAACQNCPTGCATCQSASSCQSCSSGYTLSGSACNANFAGKLQIGNIFMMVALFLGFALIIKQ